MGKARERLKTGTYIPYYISYYSEGGRECRREDWKAGE